MKNQTTVIFTIALSLFFSSLTGCAQIADDVVKQGAKVVKHVDVPNSASSKVVQEGAEQISKNSDELIKFAGPIIKSCAKDMTKSSLEQLITKVIDSGYTQITRSYLLQVSQQAIQECFDIKAGNVLYQMGDAANSLINDYATSLVSEIEQQYQGQINFVN
jgi:hypothetical protein